MFLIIVQFPFDKSLNREYKPKQVNRREWRICQLKKLFWKLFFRCKCISIRRSIITQASENTSDQRIGTTTEKRRNVFLIGEEGSQARSTWAPPRPLRFRRPWHMWSANPAPLTFIRHLSLILRLTYNQLCHFKALKLISHTISKFSELVKLTNPSPSPNPPGILVVNATYPSGDEASGRIL